MSTNSLHRSLPIATHASLTKDMGDTVASVREIVDDVTAVQMANPREA
ncbi:MAG TPA: hypothetical protein VF221_14830 [Chloroflexota bacterium]